MEQPSSPLNTGVNTTDDMSNAYRVETDGLKWFILEHSRDVIFCICRSESEAATIAASLNADRIRFPREH
jgi:hypothetical protein